MLDKYYLCALSIRTRLISRHFITYPTAPESCHFPNDHFHRININDNSYAAAPFRARSSSRFINSRPGASRVISRRFSTLCHNPGKAVISHLFWTIEKERRLDFFVPYHVPTDVVSRCNAPAAAEGTDRRTGGGTQPRASPANLANGSTK